MVKNNVNNAVPKILAFRIKTILVIVKKAYESKDAIYFVLVMFIRVRV